MKTNYYLLILFAILILLGCQGRPKEKPPIHPILDMDFQPKYEYQEKSPFFKDRISMRKPVPGAVARDRLYADSLFYTGKTPDGEFVTRNPIPVTYTGLKRGQERFNIYCSPCHSKIGDGKGIMISRGYVPPPSFHTDLIRNYPDGHIFDVISNGIRNMPSYGHQIPAQDRWLIISYIRALQRSQNASIEDIPVEMRDKIK